MQPLLIVLRKKSVHRNQLEDIRNFKDFPGSTSRIALNGSTLLRQLVLDKLVDKKDHKLLCHEGNHSLPNIQIRIGQDLRTVTETAWTENLAASLNNETTLYITSVLILNSDSLAINKPLSDLELVTQKLQRFSLQMGPQSEDVLQGMPIAECESFDKAQLFSMKQRICLKCTRRD